MVLVHVDRIFWQETHLQKALTAQQFYGTAEARAIPIPEVQSVDDRYCKMYTPDFKLSKQYIHIQGGRRSWNCLSCVLAVIV